MAIALQDVLKAREVVRHFVHNTPVLRCSNLDQLSKLQLYFKCENLQKTGSFKVSSACSIDTPLLNLFHLNALQIRGALNAAKNCDKKDPILVTHSSGNHAQGVAMAAKLCGFRAHVVMPEATIPSKKQAVLDMGAKVTTCISTEQVSEYYWTYPNVHWDVCVCAVGS